MEPNVRSVHPKQALAVYAESLVGASRVVVFGNATHGLGSRFAELGARSVEVWDPDAIRAIGEAERVPDGVTVQLYASAHATPLRSFDLAVVPDLGLFEDAADLIARIREMVGERGVALVAATNRDAAPHQDVRAFDYYELFDLVAAEFSEVRMVAEVPFLGVALVRLGDDDDLQTVSVDTQLADGDRAADAFVVVASQRPLTFDPYTIIELSSASVGRVPREIASAPSVLAQALEQVDVQQEEAQRKIDALHTELQAQMAAGAAATDRVSELEGSLRDQATRAAELEAALVERARHLSDLLIEVEEMRAAAEAGQVAAAEMEQIGRRADRAERRGGELERELASVADVYVGELVRFEEGLRERARAVQGLEAELIRREKMVRELASALEEASLEQAPPEPSAQTAADPTSRVDGGKVSEENARLREQLNGLALDIARREGEAQATAWTVAELERRLAQTAGAVAPAPDGEALRAALDELDALRRAMAQEHEARRRAESAEGTLRAEVARQAALLEQMGRPEDAPPRDVADRDAGERPDAPNP